MLPFQSHGINSSRLDVVSDGFGVSSVIRFPFLILLVLAAGFFVSPQAQAIPAGCVLNSYKYECNTQGEAAAACEEVRATQNVGWPNAGECIPWGSESIACKWINQTNQSVQAGCNSTEFSGIWLFTWPAGQACADQPDMNIFTDNPSPASLCQDGCTYNQTGGVEVCSVTNNWCLTPYAADGNDCAVGSGASAPDGCSIVNEVVVCDCVQNPAAPFCPGGSNDDDATDNGDGTSSAPGDDGSDPDPGGPGGGDPGGDAPGSCSAGDPDCFDSGGGVCDAGETCTTGGVGDGGDETCDPLTQNCEGEGTAGTAGSCANEPSCDGDAIQCAILVQSWKNTCLTLDLAGEKPPWEGDSDYGRDLADEATSVDISTGLDDGGFAAGSCPSDISIPVFATSISIEFQPLCDLAGVIRLFVILFTLMWAGPYVIRAF